MSTLTLYDTPASNHGARVRIVIYKKELELGKEIAVKNPQELGGHKSEEFLKLNPRGKFPVLVSEHGNIPESDSIARYLLDRFEGRGETFMPRSLEERTRSNILTRLHDTYISPIQGCMYKAEPPFGAFAERKKAIEELKRQWQIIDASVHPSGPYMAGAELSLADAALFPTVAFLSVMAPKFLPSGQTWDAAAFFGASTYRVFRALLNDPAFSRVSQEITEALQSWEEAGRWKDMLHAELRDKDAPTIFDRIIQKKIPSTVVFEDDDVLVFNDINPQAPTHLLLIPKERLLLTQLRFATTEHQAILGKLLCTAAKVSKQLKLGGFRVVINDGADAQQSVFHLHLHILAGRNMRWPPG